MRAPRRLTRSSLVLVAAGILLGETARVALAEEPDQCPVPISPSGDFLGETFYKVPMTLEHNPAGGNVGYYVNDLPNPISIPDNSRMRWEWQYGAGTFTCWKQNLGVITIHWQQLIPPADGSLVPWGTEEDCGGDSEQTQRVAPGAGSGFQAFGGPIAFDCVGGGGGGGTGGGSGDGDTGSCWDDYGDVWISYDGGDTWDLLYEGWYTECDDGSIYLAYT